MNRASVEARLRDALASTGAPAFERCLFADAAAFERAAGVAIATNRLVEWEQVGAPFETRELRPYTVWQRALIVGVAPGDGAIDVSRFRLAGWGGGA